MTELYAIPDPTDPIDSADEIMTSNQSSVAGTGYRPLGTVIIGTLAAGGAIASGDLAVIQQGGIVVRKAIGDMAEQDKAAVGITGGNIDGTVIGATTPAAGTFTTVQTTGTLTVNYDASSGGVLAIDKADGANADVQVKNEGVNRYVIRLTSGEVTEHRSFDSGGVLIDTPLRWANTATTDKITAARGVTISDTTDASSPTDGNASLHTNGGASIEKTLYANAIEDTPIGASTPAAGTFNNLTGLGDVTVGDAASNAQLYLDKGAGNNGNINFLDQGVIRWVMRVDSSEGFALRAYDSSGGFLDEAIEIAASEDGSTKLRSNRGVTITNTTDASSPTDSAASLHTNGGISAEGRIVGNVMSMGPRANYTIASGAITVTNSNLIVDTEGAAATDDLDTITLTGVQDGDILKIRTASNARDVTLKDGTGNLELASDFLMDSTRDSVLLIWDSGFSTWHELSRSSNA